MSDNLKLWLRQQSARLCADTLHRVPNMLPDEDDLIHFLSVLVDSVGVLRELQLANVQSWALMAIGHDAPAAYDWMVLLRVLKEEIGHRLEMEFSAERALYAWRQIDDVLTYAIIEATQLASDMQRSELLSHMEQLRRQQEKFKESKTKFIAVAAHELKTPSLFWKVTPTSCGPRRKTIPGCTFTWKGWVMASAGCTKLLATC